MRKLLLLLVTVSGLCFGSSAFIFNYDQIDLIYDPVVGDSIDTGYWVEQTLISLGDDVDSGTSLPTDLGQYDAVFMMMGMYTC